MRLPLNLARRIGRHVLEVQVVQLAVARIGVNLDELVLRPLTRGASAINVYGAVAQGQRQRTVAVARHGVHGRHVHEIRPAHAHEQRTQSRFELRQRVIGDRRQPLDVRVDDAVGREVADVEVVNGGGELTEVGEEASRRAAAGLGDDAIDRVREFTDLADQLGVNDTDTDEGRQS